MNAMLLFGVGITVLLVLFVGMYVGRKVEGDSQNFLVAGRMLPIYLVAPALMVAAVDSNATVGNMDLSSSSGFWAGASLAIGLAIALFLSGIFIAKPMNEMGLFSLGDFFRVKYGRAFEKLAAAQGALVTAGQIERMAREHGAHFERIDTQWLSGIASILYDGAWVAERWSDLGAFVTEHADDVFPVTRGILESGNRPDLTASDAFSAYHTVSAARARARALLDDAVLVMPTTGGTFTRDEVRADPVRTNSFMGLYTNHCNLCDLVAVDVPAGEASENHPFGITLFSAAAAQGVLLSAAEAFGQAASSVTVAVCGQHMRGFALHSQLEDLGAEYLGAARTATTYRLFALPGTLVKPGLLRSAQGGASIEVELYRMSAAAFGALVASAPAPLGFGNVELADGSEVNGFLVEASAVVDAGGEPVPTVREITDLGSFAAFVRKE